MTMNFSAFKRTLGVAVVWTAAMAVLFATSPAASGQESEVVPGTGNAFAQGYKVDPRSGRLSLGIGYGVSLAGHQNNVAQAESRSVDLGIIGTTLAAEGCDGGDPTLSKDKQPQPLTATSRDDDAGAQKQESEWGVDKVAYADDSPFARSEATTAAAGDPAAFQIGNTHSETESGIIDGARIAKAVTQVGSITFAGGQVVLRGLEWKAVYQTAPTEDVQASFSIKGIEVGGQSVPFPSDDPAAGLDQANEVLNPLGFQIVPPSTRVASGIAFVDPMRIGIIPSDTRDGVLGPVFTGVQPVRKSVFDFLLEQSCSFGSAILVGDVVLGSITGAGSLNLEIGGVTATSHELKTSSFLHGLPGGASLPPLSPASPASPSVAGNSNTRPSSSSFGSTGGAISPNPVSSDNPSTEPTPAPSGDETAIADVAPVSGSRGGPLAAVGLGGLALLVALALADVQKMRRAQRSVPMEVLA